MRFSSELIPGILLQRYKRFLADVRLSDGRVVTAHCTNTGSMLGCRAAGSRVYLSQRQPEKGGLGYTWELIQVGTTWVGINTFYPNRLVVEAIQSGRIKELQGYEKIVREVRTRSGVRLDLRLERPGESCFVEVKNVTLAVARGAAFPDAITDRGTKHLKELVRLRKKGHRAAVVFIVQREDCTFFRPADEIDKEYGRWLRKAVQACVEVLPYRATVSPREIEITDRLPVVL